MPAGQEWLGEKAAQLISEELHTKVSVGRVDLGFLNRIIIDDVYLYDQRQKEMLKAGRLSVKMRWTALAEGRIDISSAQLFGTHILLYKENEQTPANFQFVVDALSSNDSTSQSKLDLRVNSLIIRHSSFKYDQLDKPQTPGQLNPNHIHVNDISAHVILKALTNDSLNVNVKRLTLNEQSGLSLQKLTMKLAAGANNAQMEHMEVCLPHSTLTADSLRVRYNLHNLSNSLQYRLKRLVANVTVSDLAFAFPNLKNHENELTLHATVNGTNTSVVIPFISIQESKRELNLIANGHIFHMRSAHPTWKATISRFSASEKTIRILQSEISQIPKMLVNLGDVNMLGIFEGYNDGSIDANSRINTGAGNISVYFNTTHDLNYKGRIATNGFKLGKLLDHQDFGILATTVNISGTKSSLYAKGNVSRFDYCGYNYKNIQLDGHYNTNDIAGKLSIDDPHVKTDIAGELKKKGKTMTVSLKGSVADLKPKALHISDQWGDAIFSAVVDANFKASSLNDAEGSIDLKSFEMVDSTNVFTIDNVYLKSGYANNKHYLKLNGDMGEAELQGVFDWNTLPQSFVNLVASKLPTMPGLPQNRKPSNNNFDININLVSTEWLRRLAGIPLTLDSPLQLEASVNDQAHTLSIDGFLPAFSYEEAHYKDASVHITSPADTMECEVTVDKLMDNGQNMNLLLQAKAANNKVSTHIAWINSALNTDAMQGELNAVTTLYTNDAGKPEADVRIQPSEITLGQTAWTIEPSAIIYSDKHLLVDYFSIRHDTQHLSIDGVASESPADTLTIDMNGIEVAYVMDLLNFHPVEFGGQATGKAFITQPFANMSAQTDLIVDNFNFELGRMGTLHAKAAWNNELKQIDIDAIIDDGPEVSSKVYGNVSPERDDIELHIEANAIRVDFLQTYTNSFLSDVSGLARGKVLLAGPLGEMDLTGQLVVDAKAHVKPLGTNYTLSNDTVQLTDKGFLFDHASIADRYGNQAFISGGIYHQHFSNMTFDLDINTDRLLAYDFRDYGDEVFCGTVIASGNVDMHGRSGEIIINCNATPLRSTVFKYNAASADAISKQDFITWNDVTGSRRENGTDDENDELFKEEPALKEEEETSSISSDLYLNFLINATPDADVRLLMDQTTGDYISLNGSGVLRASYHNHGAFQMFGTYTVERGTYGITIQNIIKKNFTFKEGGTIIFGGNPMDANLQLQAIHTVNGVSLSDLNIGNTFSNNTIRVNCLMNILGQAGAPRVEFDLDMPTVNSEEKQMIRSVITSEQEMNQQVLYLLGIGRFYTQGINNANTQQYGQTELAMQSFLSGTLSTQINEVISQVIKTDDWNFGANISTGNEGWHNAEYEGLISGRMLDNRLLINGQFGYRDNATQATPSFIGDFDIRYLLQPNGNLALKVYNQTNDRYFTHSSLNTQGIGLIIKRDFNGLRDLFTRRKK